MFAIVSDIHGNLEAFSTVLAEIERRQVQHIVCLGDVIGYGPNPTECLDLVMSRCRATLMGNHDFGILYEPSNFNDVAEQSCFWTRRCFENEADKTKRANRWRFMANLAVRIRTPEFIAVHASPRRPINEYIFPDDIYTNPGKFVSIFERFERLCFVGHTHQPGVFLEGPDFYSPDELDYKYDLTDEKAIINVGSVGQPRDRDPRTSFVVVTDTRIEFIRLEYDIDKTVKKIEAIPELDNYSGTRLLDGR
jgi:diadenosine tetraphosphatase ApaH/serine/threonine PP2A family protein phosphatase